MSNSFYFSPDEEDDLPVQRPAVPAGDIIEKPRDYS